MHCVFRQGGAEKLGDEAIGVMLDKVIKLLAYLNDKDLFSEFYRKRLSRRLLQDKIVEHHEMQVLAQLKAQCGAQFTGKVRPPCPVPTRPAPLRPAPPRPAAAGTKNLSPALW